MAEALFSTENLMAVLQDFAKDVLAGYRETLERNGHKATGNLIDHAETRIEVNGSHYIVWLDNLEDYWKYIEYGTKAHWPPKDAILNWIKIKRILPSPDENGKIPTQESLAFLIQRSIAGKSPNQAFLRNPNGGTIGTDDFEKTREVVIAYYTERLQEALHRDCLNYIEKVLPE